MLSFLGNLNSKRVLDAGCGKGRFLRVLKNRFKKADLHGLDISKEMIRSCPKGVQTSHSSISDMPYPNNYFDCIYCVEALGHTVKIEKAVKEMARVLKAAGKIIIIDKNKDVDKFVKMTLRPEPWEQWFKPRQIMGLLQKHRIKSVYKFIPYDSRSLLYNLFIAWEGVKAAK
jgi:malonyl-CoA O-methyltransferase